MFALSSSVVLFSLLGPALTADGPSLLLLTRQAPPGERGDAAGVTGDPTLDRHLSESRVEAVFPRPPRGWRDPIAAAQAGLDRWFLVHTADEGEAERLLADLERFPEVESVEMEGQCEWYDTVPNDPDFSRQWALQNGILNGPKVWDRVTSVDTVVAVLDSGADVRHKDLAANVWINPGEIPGNGVDDDGNGLVDDVNGWDFHSNDSDPDDNVGHGTHTSGIVGAVGDNDRQVCGVMWGIPVMTIKIGDFTIRWSNAAQGITYAADMGADVISMSWGDSRKIDVVKSALDYAVSLDVLPVAAAGNDSSERKGWPAGYKNTMAVISSNSSDRRSGFSTHGDWCDLAAPGEDILSLQPGNKTGTFSGTSMACPYVAGVAGVIRALNPMLDRIDTRWALNDSAVDLGSAGFDSDFGWGRLDMLAAVERAEMLRIEKTMAAPGDSVALDLSLPSAPGMLHVLLPSRFGRGEGTPLSGFDPADVRYLRLVHDPLFFHVVLTHPNGLGIFTNFVGNLDAGGSDRAVLHIPGGNLFVGLNLSFAWLGFDPADLQRIAAVSNTQALEIR